MMPRGEENREDPRPDTRVTIFLPREWHERLRDRAHKERTSIGKLLRDMVRDRMDTDPPAEYAAA